MQKYVNMKAKLKNQVKTLFLAGATISSTYEANNFRNELKKKII